MTTTDDHSGGVETMTLDELGGWLIEQHVGRDQSESGWLRRLAEFDKSQGWVLDGQMSCVEWMVWKLKLAKATAYEKLLVARELMVRPIVAAALEAGRISYSAARMICRIKNPDDAVDQALADLAESNPLKDLEQAIRRYQLLADQERPPKDAASKRDVTCRRRGDGTVTFELTVTDAEADEFMTALRAMMCAEPDPEGTDSARAESAVAPIDEPSPGGRRVDALMAMVRGGRVGAERYTVHLVRRDGRPELVDGTPLDEATAEVIECDCSTVEHTVSETGEPLSVGRRRRTWNEAQRRAILVRDKGTCRFPGCQRRVTDVHHVRWWERGGPTDVSNGMLACPHHHTLLHKGFDASGDANGPLTFTRPNGLVVGCR